MAYSIIYENPIVFDLKFFRNQKIGYKNEQNGIFVEKNKKIP